MNIDVAESLAYSWLKHVKGCQIIHRNWKGVAESEPQISDDIMKAYENAIKAKIISRNKNVRKLETQIKQELKQTECDVLGLEYSQEGTNYYAVEAAYHSNGLNYAKGNKNKIGSKLFRIAIALKHYLNISTATLYFISPIVREKDMEIIKDVVTDLKNVLKDLGSFKVELYFNEDFYVYILDITKNKEKQNIDLSELCIRSYDLADLYNKMSKKDGKVDGMVKSDVEKIKIGMLVRTQFIPRLYEAYVAGALNESEIKELLEWRINNYSVLKEEDKISDTEKSRYYARPIMLFGRSYRVCNHWFAKNKQSKKDLEDWIERLNNKINIKYAESCEQKEKSVKIGKFAQNKLRAFLMNRNLDFLNQMCDIEEARKAQLGLPYPLLIKVEDYEATPEWHDRYYRSFTIDKDGCSYRLCNEWHSKQEKQLKNWMRVNGWKDERTLESNT